MEFIFQAKSEISEAFPLRTYPQKFGALLAEYWMTQPDTVPCKHIADLGGCEWYMPRILNLLLLSKEELQGPRCPAKVNLQLTDFELLMPLVRVATKEAFQQAFQREILRAHFPLNIPRCYCV